MNTLKLKLKRELKSEQIKNNFKFNYYINNLLFPPIKKKSKSRLILKGRKNAKNTIIFNKIELSLKRYSSSKNNILEKKIIKKLNKKKIHYYNKKPEKNKIRGYSDYELNELQYEKALKLDKRNLFQIYWAILKREHLIIFSFCNCYDYNLLSVKISRFLFLIIGDMALNTFFFSDDSMHKLFLNYGKYNFIQQIPEIIYSTIISLIIEIFLCYLSLTDKYFYFLKSNFKKGDKKNIKKIVKYIKLKLVIFFIFIFVFFIVYWYIITVFCGVYRNTQIAFIKDSILSLSLCLIYPFILYFISSSLRFCSLRYEEKNYKCLYNLSYFFPFF